uniref:Uncharacterized protein LOC105115393 n=1 Tax=Rhizophora mucronata TaxID=61149 RepID=A0A2P2KDI2_RHIMU
MVICSCCLPINLTTWMLLAPFLSHQSTQNTWTNNQQIILSQHTRGRTLQSFICYSR